MTSTAKPTPGPWDGAAFSDKDWVIYSTDENQKFDICHFFGDDRHVDEVEANAMLLLEAAEAFNETNLTPRQLLERVRELEAEQAELVQFFTELANDSVVFGLDTEFGDGFSVGVKTVCDAIKAALGKHGEQK